MPGTIVNGRAGSEAPDLSRPSHIPVGVVARYGWGNGFQVLQVIWAKEGPGSKELTSTEKWSVWGKKWGFSDSKYAPLSAGCVLSILSSGLGLGGRAKGLKTIALQTAPMESISQ